MKIGGVTTMQIPIMLFLCVPRQLRLSVVFFLAVSALFLVAKANAEPDTAQADTRDLLADLSQSCHLTGEFSQSKQLPGFDAPINARGDFFYSCELGLIWRTTAPITEAFVYPLKKSAAKVSVEDTFVNLDGRAQKHLGKLLNNLIGGNREYLRQTFDISDLDDTLVLEPRKRRMKKFIEAINIVDKDGGAQITLFQGNREKLVLEIANAKEHASLSLGDCTEGYGFSAPSCRYLFE